MMMSCLRYTLFRTQVLSKKALALFLSAALALAPVAAAAQSNRMVPVRDAETEALLREYASPILRAAKLNPRNVEIVLIRDFNFNAFVANGQRIFVHVGAITQSKTPNQLIGVLAHEAGHIAGGHLATLRQKLDSAQTRAIIGMLLGIAAVAAAGSSGSNIGNAAPAALMGPQDIIRRDLLAYVRAQEQTADQSAINYLNHTGQSGRGMLEVFQQLANDSLTRSSAVDPYTVTHPMPNERIALLERLVKASPSYSKKDSASLQLRHDMVRAKIIGFLRDENTIRRAYPPSDTSLPARYANAIAAYRFGETNSAIRDIDALIATNTSNPYFWELKGQALLEAGRAGQSLDALKRAVALAPNSGLIRSMLGQALVAQGNYPAAITELRKALAQEPEDPSAYRYIAMAYGNTGKIAEADLASAQAALYEGDSTTARELAARAKTRFKQGSPGWLQADDIVSINPDRKK